MDYQKRLDEVNKNCNDITKTVWDSIDRPIRPLIYELHRIGLKTKFSCCGFNYDGEEEPKNHHKDLTYVFVFNPTKESMNNFFRLCDLSKKCGWNMTYFENGIWDLNTKNPLNYLYDKEKNEKAIHDYESQVVRIFTLTHCLKELSTINENIAIVDGNRTYHEIGMTEWQVKPKRSISLINAKLLLKKQLEKEINI